MLLPKNHWNTQKKSPAFNECEWTQMLHQCCDIGWTSTQHCDWVHVLWSSSLTFSHSAQWFLPWDVYRYQPIYRTLAIVELQYMQLYHYVTWSCEKIQTLFISRAIWEYTAHVQWIKCSPKGSHLIHWTSAVFFHIALKWTPFTYRIGLP